MNRWLEALLRRGRPADAPGADGVVTHDVDQSHDEVAGFWTDERVAEATPREQRRPPPDPPTDRDT